MRFTKQIILSVLIFALSLAATNCVSPFQSAGFLKTSSPNNTYTVELVGNPSSPTIPIIDHQTRLNLLKNEQLIVKNALVDRYDIFDSGIDEKIKEYKWINDSALRLSPDVANSENNPNSIIVRNKTGETVKYLQIIAGDILFIFGLPPNSKSEFSIPKSLNVVGQGEFADGKTIEKVEFHRPANDKTTPKPLHYCLTVNDDDLDIADLLINENSGEDCK
jgi:hypothetical protein